MGHQFMPHISDAKSTNHGKNAQPHDHMYLESAFLPYRGHDHTKGKILNHFTFYKKKYELNLV